MSGELPSGWTISPIARFLSESRISGSTGKTANKLTVKLYAKGVIPKDERFEGSENTRYFQRQAGQFIYSRLDFLNGAFGIVPPELDGRESTADLPAFDFTPGVDPQWFLSYVTQPWFYEQQSGAAIGSRKARRITPEEFLRMEIPTPPLPEQKKIAAILSSVDEAIQATQAVIDQTRRVKEGLLQDLLTRGIGHTRLKMTEIGEIPEGWEVRALSELCADDGMVGGPFGSDLTAGDYVDQPGVPVLRGGNVRPGEFIDSGFVYVTQHKAAALNRNTAAIGDLIMTQRGASFGQAALIPQGASYAHYVVSQTMMRMRVNNTLVLPDYLEQYICSRRGQSWLHRQGTGNAQPHLNLTTFRSMPVAVPPIEEQAVITNRLLALDVVVREGSRHEKRLTQIKSGLLTDLLSGKVRVTP
jgi:type I restriction enzyme S subunit